MRKANSLLPILLGAALLLGFFHSCESNYPPKIYDKEMARLPGLNSTAFVLRVDAKDANQDELSYEWSSAIGEFPEGTNKNETTWQGPQDMQDKEYKVFIEISDGKDFIRDSFLVPIAAPTFGLLLGVAYYQDSKIPLGNAVVSMWGKTDTTNLDGEFSLDGIMAGRQTLYASKEGFDDSEIDLLIQEGVNEASIGLASTLHTTKLYGQLLGNMSGEAKPYLKVIILNPDFSESKLTATSDGSGYYELPYVPHGLRYLMVRDEQSIKMETILYVDTQEKLFNVPIKEPYEFTDERDGHLYKAVRIGGQIWMMENLAYLPEVSSSTAVHGAWVYGYYGNNVEEAKATYNYRTYGCLYDWSTAVADTFANGKDICPPGWHMPSDAEFTLLEVSLGMNIMYQDSVGWRFSGTVGRKMKASDGWIDDGNGTNSSSFTALPSGNRSTGKVFLGMEGYTSFWTTDEFREDEEYAWRRYLYHNMEANGRFTDFKNNGYPVRCLKDN